eukprot:COSAG02_NODE_29237_length_573_cov_1.101266_1_plen_88_part_10
MLNQSPFPPSPMQLALPMGLASQVRSAKQKPTPQPPELACPRFMNYYADYSGCGHWRMIWPEQVMNAHNKAVVHGTTVMNGDARQYIG